MQKDLRLASVSSGPAKCGCGAAPASAGRGGAGAAASPPRGGARAPGLAARPAPRTALGAQRRRHVFRGQCERLAAPGGAAQAGGRRGEDQGEAGGGALSSGRGDARARGRRRAGRRGARTRPARARCAASRGGSPRRAEPDPAREGRARAPEGTGARRRRLVAAGAGAGPRVPGGFLFQWCGQ